LTLVIDASVAVKWVLRDRPGEYDTDKALALLLKIGREGIQLLQPEHWRVEVLSVVARFAPERFADTVQLLEKLNASRIESTQVLERALALTRQLKHHLSDTLYHAIAIEHGATLITADEAHFAKAYRLGNIKLLVNLSFPPT
jgi:predicted nucleic acid-binding protein